MNNAELFKKVFWIYAEEFWSYTEKQMLDWINADVPERNVGDMISRQAAIDAADRADYTGLAVEDVKKVTDEVVKELKQLPSAEPEQIVAKQILWMEIKEKPGFKSYTPHCKCSNCGHELILKKINYCYVCGARFVGKEKI